MDATNIVLELSKLQLELVSLLATSHHLTKPDSIRTLPDGSFELDGITWSYRRHGYGVTFRSSQGIVNAHIGMFEHPDAIDAWRLLLYLDSRGVQEMTFQGVAYDVGDEKRLEEALARMADAGLLEACAREKDAKKRLYRPTKLLTP